MEFVVGAGHDAWDSKQRVHEVTLIVTSDPGKWLLCGINNTSLASSNHLRKNVSLHSPSFAVYLCMLKETVMEGMVSMSRVSTRYCDLRSSFSSL
jgi:hypothetical protein